MPDSKLNVTPFDLAQRFIGEVVELDGARHSPFIQWCHECVGLGSDQADETPWCSSFVNRIAWFLRLPRSKSAAARSWLGVGTTVGAQDATVGYDVVILKRGGGNQPGPEVLKAPGHVGFFAGWETSDKRSVRVLGGNQSDGVTIAAFSFDQVLGFRRLS